MESVVTIMAILAILIACLGLFGLSAITTESRIKEIGIRKVLGASVGQILVQLSRSFAILIVLAFVVFSPITYYMMGKWLENFAYHVDISPLIFFVGGLNGGPHRFADDQFSHHPFGPVESGGGTAL